jgi:hypothetical protein
VQSEPQVCFGLRRLRAQPHAEFLCESRRLEEALRLRSYSLRKLRHPIGGLRRIVANPFQTGIEQKVGIPSRTLQAQAAGESAREVPIRIPKVADPAVREVGRLCFGRLPGVIRKDRDPDYYSLQSVVLELLEQTADNPLSVLAHRSGWRDEGHSARDIPVSASARYYRFEVSRPPSELDAACFLLPGYGNDLAVIKGDIAWKVESESRVHNARNFHPFDHLALS